MKIVVNVADVVNAEYDMQLVFVTGDAKDVDNWTESSRQLCHRTTPNQPSLCMCLQCNMQFEMLRHSVTKAAFTMTRV